MPIFRTRDDVGLFYKDWGPQDAPAIMFHHGWPLSADDWDAQMLFFLGRGYRVIAHDRRGHGRSEQTDAGNDMDTYAADVATLADALDLKNAVHIGHSTNQRISPHPTLSFRPPTQAHVQTGRQHRSGCTALACHG